MTDSFIKYGINKNYEFRICSTFNNFNGPWSENQKFKTICNCDSIILDESERKDEFLAKIYEWIEYKHLELLYRGTKDGPESKIFHDKCNNQGPTICLYKNSLGNIFGGYASISWENNTGCRFSAPESFLFTLTNIFNIEPTKFPSKNDSKEILQNNDRGPSFVPLYNNSRCLYSIHS